MILLLLRKPPKTENKNKQEQTSKQINWCCKTLKQLKQLNNMTPKLGCL